MPLLQLLVKMFETIRKFFVPKNTIKIVAIFISVSTYYWFFEYNAPSDNVITQLFSSQDEIEFNSAGKSGMYWKVGQLLHHETVDSKGNEKNGHGFKIKNISTDGDLENLNKIISQENTIGLVDELVAPPGSYAREQANFVTPVYSEQLFIYYKKALFDTLAKSYKPMDGRHFEPGLKTTLDTATLVFLNKAKINAGPHGSGSRLIASYLLDAIDGFSSKHLSSYRIKPNRLAKDGDLFDKVDVHFSLIGKGSDLFLELTSDSSEYDLMCIDHALIAKVNSKYNLNLQFSSITEEPNTDCPDTLHCDSELRIHSNFGFEWLREDEIEIDTDSSSVGEREDVTTLSSQVYLTASSDVQLGVIIEVLEILENYTKKTGETSPISKMNFLKPVEELHQKANHLFYQNLSIFIGGVLLSTILIIWFIVTIISRRKMSKHYGKISSIYKTYIPLKYEIANNVNDILVPELKGHATKRISHLSEGFKVAFAEISNAFTDYEEGGITQNDYKNLLQEYHIMVNDLCGEMHRFIFYAIKSNETITQETLERFFIASFLHNDQYKELSKLLQTRNS